MIKINITERDLEGNNLLKTMNNVLKEHFSLVNSGDMKNLSLKQKKDFYDGTTPDGEFLLVNKWKYIVDVSSKVFIGQQFDLTTSGNKSDKASMRFLTDRFRERHLDVETSALGKSASNYGTAFLMVYNEQGDNFPRFKKLDPLSTNVVYKCDIAETPLLGFWINEVREIKGDTTQIFYQVWVYLKDKMTILRTPYSVGAFKCDFDKMSLSSLFAGNRENDLFFTHDFNDVPIVEFQNNSELKGDAECVAGAIVEYNKLRVNELKNVDDQINSLLVFKNVRLGNETERKEVFEIAKRESVLSIEGENVDAKFLNNPLDYQKTELVASALSKEIEYISHCPILSSNDFTQNASDPILKLKTKPMLDLAKGKEVLFTSSFMRVLQMVKDYGNNFSDANRGKYDFDMAKVILEYSHSLPSNDQDMITMITNLNNAKCLNPSVALQQLSFIDNVDSYISGAKEHNDYLISLDKKKSEIKNIEGENPSNNGANEHNLALINEKPLTSKELDNKRNFNLGNAQKLTENDK